MTTMKALRAHTRGGPETLVYEQAPRPVPGPGEVLIAVHAAAITFAELGWDLTWTRLDGSPRTPTIPSHEFSGVVEELGPEVEGVAVGDEVYGLVPFDHDGAAAELLSLPVRDLAAKPTTVSHQVAAAVPLAALTAWQALVDHAKVLPGERVLVHGGAGGVGTFVVQVATALGADVTATTLSQDVDFVLDLGAGRVVDVEVEAFDAEPQAYDVVVDTVGGSTLERSFAVLRRGGRLVTLQAPPAQELVEKHGVQGIFFVVTPDRVELQELARLVDAGELRVVIGASWPLAEGRAAYESGSTLQRGPGKTVLVVREQSSRPT